MTDNNQSEITLKISCFCAGVTHLNSLRWSGSDVAEKSIHSAAEWKWFRWRDGETDKKWSWASEKIKYPLSGSKMCFHIECGSCIAQSWYMYLIFYFNDSLTVLQTVCERLCSVKTGSILEKVSLFSLYLFLHWIIKQDMMQLKMHPRVEYSALISGNSSPTKNHHLFNSFKTEFRKLKSWSVPWRASFFCRPLTHRIPNTKAFQMVKVHMIIKGKMWSETQIE